VLDEIESITGRNIIFVDDNLIGYSKESYSRAVEIFKGMIDRQLNKKWWMQTSINAAEDEQVISLAAQAGCMFVFIGFETIRNDMLEEMKKGINLRTGIDNYKKVISAFHKHGIGVLGAIIIGNDYESPSYYEELADFLLSSGIDMFQICILTPLPGTSLMEQLQKEERLLYQDFPQDWDKYRLSYMVHQPKGADVELVYSGNNYLKKKIYSFPTYQYRLLKSLLTLKNFTNFYTVYQLNKAYKKGWLNAHYARKATTAPALEIS
jgi:radical SAM superfamily enzyme YgiQ (UPF0313 family)